MRFVKTDDMRNNICMGRMYSNPKKLVEKLDKRQIRKKKTRDRCDARVFIFRSDFD
jgi:hypothetical protein